MCYSKAARRKKREEAEKIPEVSKEIYYDVAEDLKTVFGSTKQSENVVKDIAWDKEEEVGGEGEEEGGEPSQTAEADTSLLAPCLPSNAEKDESSGFKFSFFGDNAEADNATEKGNAMASRRQTVPIRSFFSRLLKEQTFILPSSFSL